MAKRIRRKISDATRFKMSIAKRGSANPMAGRHHSEATKRRIAKSMREYWKTINDDWDGLIY